MLVWLEKINNGLTQLFEHIVNAWLSEKGYSSLFKAGVVLVGAAMIALSQTGTFLYEKDIAAHKAAFPVENATEKSIEKVDCGSLSSSLKLKCQLAKYEMQELNSSLKLFSKIVMICLWFGAICIVISVVGFIAAGFRDEKDNKRKIKN